MRAFFACFRFYLGENLWVLGFGLATAIVGVILGAAGPRLWGFSGPEIREALGLLSAIGLPPFLALILGAKSLATPHAMHNLRFLSSRGWSWASLWLGALASSLVLAVAAGALGTLPALGSPLSASSREGWLAAAGVAILAAWALGHLGGLLFQHRSSLLLLDLAAIAATTLAWRALVGSCTHLVEPGPAGAVLSVFVAGAVLLAAAASFVTLLRSHVHQERARRWASLTLWPALLLPALLGLASLRVLAWRAPHHLRAVTGAVADASGRYWLVQGASYPWLRMRTVFLWDSQTGTRKPAGFLVPESGWYWFARSVQEAVAGTTAAVFADQESSQIALLDLATGARRRLQLALSPPLVPCALGPGGQTLALVQWKVSANSRQARLVLVETERGNTLDELDLGESRAACRAFPSHLEVLQVSQTDRQVPPENQALRVAIWRVGWQGEGIFQLFERQLPPGEVYGQAQLDAENLLLQLHRSGDIEAPITAHLLLLDKKGNVRWELEAPKYASATLVDNGLVVVTPGPDGTELALVSRDGQVHATTAVPLRRLFRCLAEATPERTIVATCRQELEGAVTLRWRPGTPEPPVVTDLEVDIAFLWSSATAGTILLRKPFPKIQGQAVFGSWEKLFVVDHRTGQLRQVLP